MNVYFFSGLGADQRVFQKINLPENFHPVFIKWIEPIANEALTDYCKRLSAQIDTTAKFSFIGLSFGGIVASEMSRIYAPEKLILISSFNSSSQLPLLFRAVGKLRLHSLMPSSFLAKANTILFWFFSISMHEEKKVVRVILNETSPAFMKWAIHTLLKWRGISAIAEIIRIHGDWDRVIPLKRVKANFVVEGGGHFMVYQKAEEINEMLKFILPNP
ncbi:MAG: alpha/beta hydrolase [Flavobacteriales bacterium]|nr:alpha/beta hydrolase [Flavobacteriales bacterium]